MRDRRFALRDRDHARPLHEHWGARGVVLDQLAEVWHQGKWRHDPSEPPSGHQPGLGEAVGADQAIIRRSEIEKRRSAYRLLAALVVQPLVHVVGDDPDPLPPAMREDRGLCFALERPARWI